MPLFITPRNIYFGLNSLEHLGEIPGEKFFIVSDKVLSQIGIVGKAVKYLEKAKREVRVFDEVEPEPSKETIEKGAKAMSEFAPDWIVGLGGGSSMDAGKAMWVIYERPDLKVEEINPFFDLNLRKKARLIAIPTTSGTGSEVTWASVITDVQQKVKWELVNRELTPDIVILDPYLASEMPPQLTADTGFDALTHAIESYTAIRYKNDFSDALAIKAIQTIFEYLPIAYKKGAEEIKAREKLHYAATMAGLAVINSAAGIAHSMGHSFGAIFKIPHGRSVALFLPYVIEYNAKEIAPLYAQLADKINIKAPSPKQAVSRLVEAIKSLLKEVGEPLCVKDLGIKEEEYKAHLEELVIKADCSITTPLNPRIPTREEFRKLFICAYEGRGVDF